MPFKSEKQRKFSCANEPKVAKDRTQRYSSRINKEKGGCISMMIVTPNKTTKKEQ